MNSQRTNYGVYLIFIAALAAIFFGYKWTAGRLAKVNQSRNLVTDAMIIEGRFKYIGPFMKLRAWIYAVDRLEQKYFDIHGTYTGPENLTAVRVYADVIARDIRQAFWDNHILLDSFIDFEALRDTLKADYGPAFENIRSGLDNSRWNMSFELISPNKWQIRLEENTDVNMDGDKDDLITYTGGEKSKVIRFRDRSNRRDYEEFLIDYSNLVGEIVPLIK